MPIVLIDGLASWLWQALGNADPGLLLMGTSTALVCAYVIRFLAISIGGIEAGLARIPPSMEQASRLLGETSTGTLRRIHLPLLRPALGAAALLVFVDTMRSEEHTSELQSLMRISYAVFGLKNKKTKTHRP